MASGTCPLCKEDKRLTKHHILDRPTSLKIAVAMKQKYNIQNVEAKSIASFLHSMAGSIYFCGKCHSQYHKFTKEEYLLKARLGEKETEKVISRVKAKKVSIPYFRPPQILIQTDEGLVTMTKFKFLRYKRFVNNKKNEKDVRKVLLSPLEREIYR